MMYTANAKYSQQTGEYSTAKNGYATANYQLPRKKLTRYLGCTCGGNNPCRGTCRTFFTA